MFYSPVPLIRTLPPAGRITVTAWSPIVPPTFLPRTQNIWLAEARKRREAYKRGDATVSSVHWLLVEKGDPIPKGALLTGLGHGGGGVFSARGWVDDGLHPGKCGANADQGT